MLLEMDPKLFSIFENTDWSAREEYALLNAIDENGYGNWDQISRRMATRSPQECEQHYNKFYINECVDFIPKHSNPGLILPNIITPYNFRIKNTDDPPRCIIRSFSSNVLAGYMPARSEFEHPYDSNAEQLMSHVSKSMFRLERTYRTGLIENLACAVYQVYNNRLQERQRRYQVMQTYGLILNRKCIIYGQSQFESIFPRHVYEKFQGYAQFMSAVDFDFILHSLYRQRELKIKLLKLKGYRSNGIQSLHGIKVYHKLWKRREKMSDEIHEFVSKTESSLNVKHEMEEGMLSGSLGGQSQQRRSAAPLEIIGLPGFDRLTENERNICRSVRLVPDAYLEFKRTLIAECDKSAGLRLQDARKAIRIDVNKTRKIYDFLIQEGLITKPNY